MLKIYKFRTPIAQKFSLSFTWMHMKYILYVHILGENFRKLQFAKQNGLGPKRAKMRKERGAIYGKITDACKAKLSLESCGALCSWALSLSLSLCLSVCLSVWWWLLKLD